MISRERSCTLLCKIHAAEKTPFKEAQCVLVSAPSAGARRLQFRTRTSSCSARTTDGSAVGELGPAGWRGLGLAKLTNFANFSRLYQNFFAISKMNCSRILFFRSLQC